MSWKSTDHLGATLTELQLITQTELEQCLASLDPNHRGVTDLLQELQRRNLITSYQYSRLNKGEFDGLVLGQYKLMYRNASGSFARVFRACNMENGDMVGLKVLRQRWANDRDAVVMFHREAELGMTLKHPNIVPIYEKGEQGDYHYFTMEFIEGGNLRDFIKIRRKLSPYEASKCLLDMCDGLAYALSKGFTHRDIKMTNVLMSSKGVAKLVDFGLAGEHAQDDYGPDEEMQRALEYATLERATDAPRNDPRSDLFFVGTIYYELLTGKPPYPRTRNREARKQFSRYKNIPPLRSIDPTLPRYVVEINERLLKINPNDRFHTPAEVADQLRDALAQIGEPSQTHRIGHHVEPATNRETKGPDKSLPTVMCIESRIKQQDMLRGYLSKRGFRVLMLGDLQRGLDRLRHNPPDCVVLMGAAIGDEIRDAHTAASSLKQLVCISVLAKEQADMQAELTKNKGSRVLVEPITLRDVRREIHLAFQRKRNRKKSSSKKEQTAEG